jgi:UDP-N-acetylmuramate--alanine ligase
MRVHLIGVGGAGVSALAAVYAARGDEVSGCDAVPSPTTRRLQARGIRVTVGHDPAHVVGQDLVVFSPAVPPACPELEAARRRTRLLSRPQALAELIAEHPSVAVAGSHGKTTVTCMLGHVLEQAGLDPTVLAGDGGSSRAGRGWLVAEADESDGSLALHRPRHGILTGVEFDHPDHFSGLDEVAALFAAYLEAIPGTALVSEDDPCARRLSARHRVSYGFDPAADYRCRADGGVLHRGEEVARLRLRIPGRHNLANATAALAMAAQLGVEPERSAAALSSFAGARRRLERLGSWRGAELYDDYGHHPTEVLATVQAARELAARRLLLVFQPHRYSRLNALLHQLAASLERAAPDRLFLTEVYAAGEEPVGPGARALAELVPGCRFCPDLESVRAALEEEVEAGDVVLLMGAGDIWRLGHELADAVQP